MLTGLPLVAPTIMSHRSDIPADQRVSVGENRIERLFDVDETIPYETQRTVQRYLSQETRHDLLQVILGHPQHLVSVTEFDYYVPKSRSTISEQLTDLADHEIVTRYHHEPNADVRDIPADFWGLTEFGVGLLDEYKYLRGLPVMRAAHDATHKTDAVQRHETAPRPALPDAVSEALEYDDPEPDDGILPDDTPLTELRDQTFYADAAPADPTVLNEDADGDRSLDELF